MTDSREQSQLREHLAQIRRAVGGIGHDFSTEIRNLDKRISRLSDATGAEAERASNDLRRDISRLGSDVDREIRRLPGHIMDAGTALGSKTKEAAGLARDAAVSAGHSAKTGTKALFARAAGVKKRPMREWTPPPPDNDPKKRSP
jgi:hypothetical protein